MQQVIVTSLPWLVGWRRQMKEKRRKGASGEEQGEGDAEFDLEVRQS